jgi:hypothetical protein
MNEFENELESYAFSTGRSCVRTCPPPTRCTAWPSAASPNAASPICTASRTSTTRSRGSTRRAPIRWCSITGIRRARTHGGAGEGEGEVEVGANIKYKPNERMCVLHISMANANIGIVLNCNSEAKKYLWCEKQELINQKVTKVMPKVFSDIHDTFIEEYLKKADSVKLPTEKTVFAMKKSLRIIETCLTVKYTERVPTCRIFQRVGLQGRDGLPHAQCEDEGSRGYEPWVRRYDREDQTHPFVPNHKFKVYQEINPLFCSGFRTAPIN